MCHRNYNRPHVPPGFWKFIGIFTGVVAVALFTTAMFWLPEGAFAAGSAQTTAPDVSTTPEFPTGLSDDEVAAIQAWNAWFFEREQAYKDAMYEQWRIQMMENSDALFTNFGTEFNQQLLELQLEVESLKNTSGANLSAATTLTGLVATPTPVVVTEIVEVQVPVEVEKIVEVERIVEVPVEVIVEVPSGDPVEIVREPSHYEYCSWLEGEMRRLRATAGNGVTGVTYLDVLLGLNCEEVGLAP